MKIFTSLMLAIGLAPLASAGPVPQTGSYVPVATEALFVPRGFDDNDDVVVSLSGNFPNTCYQLAHAELKTEATSSRILVQQMAFVTPGPCSRILVPFTNSVHLGRLRAGNYVIQTKDNGRAENLPVSRSTLPTQDDYLYAPITSATVMPYAGKSVAYLEGRITNSCMKMKGIKVTYTGRTIQLLPVMELVKEGDDRGPCRAVNLPLRLTKPLEKLNRGQYLLHVRSLNGNSINLVFNAD